MKKREKVLYRWIVAGVIVLLAIGGCLFFGYRERIVEAKWHYYNEFPEDFFDADNNKKPIKVKPKKVQDESIIA